ncbi:MAG: beta-glucanase (GH16 family) [Paraglaciecola sp.]|jgi:endo-1,3-1,4-beta-glycanase ExoK
MTPIKQSMKLVITMMLLSGCVPSSLENNLNSMVELPTAYEGYTGSYSGFSLVLDERFNTLDEEIWEIGDGAVGGEAACRFQPQGVQVEDGLLNLIIRQETILPGWSNDHQMEKSAYEFSCGELRTTERKKIRYGRYETRMKAPARAVASGYISSLFTYTNDGEPREWEEIDVELEGGRPDKFQANLIYGKNTWQWWATRKWGAWEDKISIAPVDEWRVYAIEWLPTEINWYVDGVQTKSLKQDALNCIPSCKPPQIYPTPIPDNLTQLMMNFWIPKDEIQDNFGGNKKRNAYPMHTQYDWIRFYQLDVEPMTQW